MKDRLIILWETIKVKLQFWGKEFWLFLSSMIFLRNFGFMVGVLFFLFLITNLFLTCYTRHGDSLQVDAFENISFFEAKKIAKNKGFELEILDSTYIPDREGGVILTQTPKPLSNVKKGRTIYLTTTKYSPEMVILPPLSESSYDYDLYSRKLAKSNYLIKTKIKKEEFDIRQAEKTIKYFYYGDDKIEDSDLDNKFEVPKGSTLEFVITTQTSSVVGIPKLVCKQYDAASFLVSSSELVIGKIIEDNTVINRESAYVWQQEPAYNLGEIISKGSSVNLYLTQNQPEACGDEF